MAAPLNVNVIELLRRPGTVKDVSATVATEDFDFADDRIVDDPIEVTIHLESLSNGIAVAGRARARWRGECRRCLEPLDESMEVAFDELYQTTLEDPDAWHITGDQIDLLPMVRENVLLSVPLGPLCRPDCPGFCPVCGADLAEEECGCDRSSTDDRWAVLDQLKGRLGPEEA
jgi:uncharacterized protein